MRQFLFLFAVMAAVGLGVFERVADRYPRWLKWALHHRWEVMGGAIELEGLAMLRIAQLRGLKTEPDYLFCPSIARLPIETPFPGE